MTATPAPFEAVATSARERQQRLAEEVAGLRARGGRLTRDDRWMLVLGGTLLPLGLLLVVLGWVGASRTVLVFEQLPYLISGGLLGVALVIAGGFVYFAYWMTLMVRETRRGRADLNAGLARLESLLLGPGGPVPVSPETRTEGRPARHATAGPVDPGGVVDPGGLVATRAGTMLHRPDCAVVLGRDGLRPATAATPGLTPCGICSPLG